MDKKTLQNREQHLNVLGWLYVGLSALLILVAFVLFVFMLFGGLMSGSGEDFVVTTLVGFGISTFMLLLSAPGFIAGYGLLKRKPWARTLSLVLALLNVMSFPVGTAVAVYTFWVMMQDDIVALLATEKKVVF